MEVKLIHTSSKRNQIVYLRTMLLSLVLFFVYYFKRKDLEALMRNANDPNIPEFIYYIFIISSILLILFFVLSRRKKIVGRLDISVDFILIESGKEVFSYNIKDLKTFSIKTDYIIPQESTVGLISSFNNWLYFEHMEKRYEYQFIIDSYFKGNQLKDLIDHWNKLDNFNFIGEK